MTKDEQTKVRAFRDAVNRLLTSASNPGRAAAALADNSPGSPYAALVAASMAVDEMLSYKPHEDFDGVRYRWLKTHHLQLGPDCWIRTGEDLDEAIDAEIRDADSRSGDQ